MWTLRQLRLYLMICRRSFTQPEIQLHCLAPLLVEIYETAFYRSRCGLATALDRSGMTIATRTGLPTDVIQICFTFIQLATSLCASFFVVVPFIKLAWCYNRMTQVRRRFIGKLCRLILSGSLAFAFILIAGDLDLAHRLPQLSKTKYAAGVLFITILLDNIVVWPVVTLIMRRHPDDAKAVFVNVRCPILSSLYAA